MHGLFPLSAYCPNKDAQTGTKKMRRAPARTRKASTQNRANTPKSLTAQTEPRYYGQVPFRGCSLMVKPQSSKLITRVRFPSSPRDLGSRRFRVEALSFSLERMTGIPSACGFVSSRARNPHAPARHPLHAFLQRRRESLPGENVFPRALGIFALQPVIPSRTILNESWEPLPHADLFPHALGIRTPPVMPNNTGPPTTLTSPQKTSLQ